METAGLSTAIMLAVAALLWFVYFLPTWIRRREYLETERTAVRLQRTVRVMAEAAEAPEELRLEASAREAARQDRIRLDAEAAQAREALQQARAAAKSRARIDAQLAEARRLDAEVRSSSTERWKQTGRGRRVARRGLGLLLLTAVGVALVQLALVVVTGPSTGAGVVLMSGGAGALAAVAGLRATRRAPRRVAAPPPVAAPAPHRAAVEARPVAEVARRSRSWTPVPLPRPRYLEHPEAAPIGPSLGAPTMDAAARLRVAAAAAKAAAEASADDGPPVTLAPRAEAAPQPAAEAPPSDTGRFAAMGRIGDLSTTVDLDEVLRRRRAS